MELCKKEVEKVKIPEEVGWRIIFPYKLEELALPLLLIFILIIVIIMILIKR